MGSTTVKFIFALGVALVTATSMAGAQPLSFLCSWEDRDLIEISVDTNTNTATRDDGGQNYVVLKLTDVALWLAVYESRNQYGLAIQMIERSRSPGGLWLDVIIASTGTVSPIAGGVCWEQ